jgi:hypothetical protein
MFIYTYGVADRLTTVTDGAGHVTAFPAYDGTCGRRCGDARLTTQDFGTFLDLVISMGYI